MNLFGRFAGLQGVGFFGKSCTELVSYLINHDDFFRRHADLALIHERAKSCAFDRGFDVGILQNDAGGFAAEFEQARLEVVCGALGDQASNTGRAGEVDTSRLRVVDQGIDHFRRVFCSVGDDVQNALRQATIDHAVADQAMQAGALF